MHILKAVCNMVTSFPAIPFFYNRVAISREDLKLFIYQGHCVYFTTRAQPSIITSGLRLIRENLKDMFI